MKTRYFSNLTWQEFGEIVPKKTSTVILPVGTIEAHGDIPLGTDNIIPQDIAEYTAEKINALIAPPVNYGITSSLLPYPGSITLEKDTYKKMILEIMLELARNKFRTIIVMNGHGGQVDELKEAALETFKKTGTRVIVVHWWILTYEWTKEFYGQMGGHAGIDETAAVMAISPELVKPERYSESMPREYKRGIQSYPFAGPIILYKEGEGMPLFDADKARKFYIKARDIILSEIKSILKSYKELNID
jgi:creatinine amidohydrolase